MPRVKRRGFRRLYSIGLSDRQAEILLHGSELLDALPADGGGFQDKEAERSAWFANRAELLKEPLGPGRRPYAFFKYELRAEPKRWWDQIRLLLENNLIEQPEARDIERNYPMLKDDPEFYYNFEDEKEVRLIVEKSAPSLAESHARLFAFAAKWHTWRGREELAARYEARKQVVRRVADELNSR